METFYADKPHSEGGVKKRKQVSPKSVLANLVEQEKKKACRRGVMLEHAVIDSVAEALEPAPDTSLPFENHIGQVLYRREPRRCGLRTAKTCRASTYQKGIRVKYMNLFLLEVSNMLK